MEPKPLLDTDYGRPHPYLHSSETCLPAIQFRIEDHPPPGRDCAVIHKPRRRKPRIQPPQCQPMAHNADGAEDAIILPYNLGKSTSRAVSAEINAFVDQRFPSPAGCHFTSDNLQTWCDEAWHRHCAGNVEFLGQLGFSHLQGEPEGLTDRSMVTLIKNATIGISDYVAPMPFVLRCGDEGLSNIYRLLLQSGGQALKDLLRHQFLICGASAGQESPAPTRWSSYILDTERRHLYIYDALDDKPGSESRYTRAYRTALAWSTILAALDLDRRLDCFVIPVTGHPQEAYSGYTAAYMVTDRLRSFLGRDYEGVRSWHGWHDGGAVRDWLERRPTSPLPADLRLPQSDYLRGPVTQSLGTTISKVACTLGTAAMAHLGMRRPLRHDRLGERRQIRGLTDVRLPELYEMRYGTPEAPSARSWGEFYTNFGGFLMFPFEGELAGMKENWKRDRAQIRPQRSEWNGPLGADQSLSSILCMP